MAASPSAGSSFKLVIGVLFHIQTARLLVREQPRASARGWEGHGTAARRRDPPSSGAQVLFPCSIAGISCLQYSWVLASVFVCHISRARRITMLQLLEQRRLLSGVTTSLNS